MAGSARRLHLVWRLDRQQAGTDWQVLDLDLEVDQDLERRGWQDLSPTVWTAPTTRRSPDSENLRSRSLDDIPS
jgi:hypothetical protein